eukprot:PhF_6_TR1960/c0_g1_i1/m.3188
METISLPLQSLFLAVLNRVFRDLSINKANLNLWKGHVVLNDLQLRRDVSLPRNIRFTSGTVRSVDITFPWSSLHNNPTVAQLKGVRITLRPSCDVVFTEEEVEKEISLKLRKVQAWEAGYALRRSCDGNGGGGGDVDDGDFADLESLQSAEDCLSCDSGSDSDAESPASTQGEEAKEELGYFGRIQASIIQNLRAHIDDIECSYSCLRSNASLVARIQSVALEPNANATSSKIVSKTMKIVGVVIVLVQGDHETPVAGPLDIEGTMAFDSNQENQAQWDLHIGHVVAQISQEVLGKLKDLFFYSKWSLTLPCTVAKQNVSLRRNSASSGSTSSWWPFLRECTRALYPRRWNLEAGYLKNQRLVRIRYAELLHSTTTLSAHDAAELHSLHKALPFEKLVLFRLLHSKPSKVAEWMRQQSPSITPPTLPQTAPTIPVELPSENDEILMEELLDPSRVKFFGVVDRLEVVFPGVRLVLGESYVTCTLVNHAIFSGDIELGNMDLVDESSEAGKKYLLVQNRGVFLSGSVFGTSCRGNIPGFHLIISPALLNVVHMVREEHPLLDFHTYRPIRTTAHHNANSKPTRVIDATSLVEVGAIEVSLGQYSVVLGGAVIQYGGESKVSRVAVLGEDGVPIIHAFDTLTRKLDDTFHQIHFGDMRLEVNASELISLHKTIETAMKSWERNPGRVTTSSQAVSTKTNFEIIVPRFELYCKDILVSMSILELRKDVDGVLRSSTISLDLPEGNFLSVLSVEMISTSMPPVVEIHDAICNLVPSVRDRILGILQSLPFRRIHYEDTSSPTQSLPLILQGSFHFVIHENLAVKIRSQNNGGQSIDVSTVVDWNEGLSGEIHTNLSICAGVLTVGVVTGYIDICETVLQPAQIEMVQAFSHWIGLLPGMVLTPQGLLNWDRSSTASVATVHNLLVSYRALKCCVGQGSVSVRSGDAPFLDFNFQDIKLKTIRGSLNLEGKVTRDHQEVNGTVWVDSKKSTVTVKRQVNEGTELIELEYDLDLEPENEIERVCSNGVAQVTLLTEGSGKVVEEVQFSTGTKLQLEDDGLIEGTFRIHAKEKTLIVSPCSLTIIGGDQLRTIVAKVQGFVARTQALIKEWIPANFQQRSTTVQTATTIDPLTRILRMNVMLPSCFVKFGSPNRIVKCELAGISLTREPIFCLSWSIGRVQLEDYDLIEVSQVTIGPADPSVCNVKKIRVDVPLDLMSMLPILHSFSPETTNIHSDTTLQRDQKIYLGHTRIWKVGGGEKPRNYITVDGANIYFETQTDSPAHLIHVADNTTLKFVNSTLHFTSRNYDGFFKLGLSSVVLASEQDGCIKTFENNNSLEVSETKKSESWVPWSDLYRVTSMNVESVDCGVRFDNGCTFGIKTSSIIKHERSETSFQATNIELEHFHPFDKASTQKVFSCPEVLVIHSTATPEVKQTQFSIQPSKAKWGVVSVKDAISLAKRCLKFVNAVRSLPAMAPSSTLSTTTHKFSVSASYFESEYVFSNGLPFLMFVLQDTTIALSVSPTAVRGDFNIEPKLDIFTLPSCKWETTVTAPMEMSLSLINQEGEGGDQSGTTFRVKHLESFWTVAAIRGVVSAVEEYSETHEGSRGWIEIEDNAGLGFSVLNRDQSLSHAPPRGTLRLNELRSDVPLTINAVVFVIAIQQGSKLYESNGLVICAVIKTTASTIKISIQSPITILNTLEIGLELKDIGSVASGAVCHVPLDVLDDSRMAVKLPNVTEWCDMGMSYRGLAQEVLMREDKRMTFLVKSELINCNCIMEMKPNGCLEMQFRALYEIRNEVGVNVVLAVYADDRTITNRPLEKGATAKIINCAAAELICVGVSFTQTSGLVMKTEEPACIYNHENPGDVSSYVILLDENDRYIALNLLIDGSTVVISTTTLIYNFTDFPILLSMFSPEEIAPGNDEDHLIPPSSKGRSNPFVLSSTKLVPTEHTPLFISTPKHVHSTAFYTNAKEVVRLACEDSHHGGFGCATQLVVRPAIEGQLILEFHPPYVLENKCPHKIQFYHRCGAITLNVFSLEKERSVPYCVQGNGTNVLSVSTGVSAKCHSEPCLMDLTGTQLTSSTMFKIRAPGLSLTQPVDAFVSDRSEGDFILLKVTLRRAGMNHPVYISVEPIHEAPLYVINRTACEVTLNHKELSNPIPISAFSSIPFAWSKSHGEEYVELAVDGHTLPLYGMRKKIKSKHRLGHLHVEVCCTNDAIFINILQSPIQYLSAMFHHTFRRIINIQILVDATSFTFAADSSLEIFHATCYRFQIDMTQNMVERCVTVHAGHLQIDDMSTANPQHPVIFVCPTHAPHSPTVAFRATCYQVLDNPRVFLRDVTFALGHMELKLHDEFLSNLIATFRSLYMSVPVSSMNVSFPTSAPTGILETLNIHVVHAHASPTLIALTLTRSPFNADNLVHRLPSTISIRSLDSAPVSIEKMEFNDLSGTAMDFTAEIIKHYTTCMEKAWLNLLGSMEVLGNPRGLIDLWMQGGQALLRDPIDGSSMFLRHTIGAPLNTVSKIVRTSGDGLAWISFDNDYIRGREAPNAPGFFAEVTQGVVGVVQKPIEGAQKNGVLGLFGGVVKGVVGAVIRPAAASLDAVATKTQNVAKKLIAKHEISRVRSPKVQPTEQAVPVDNINLWLCNQCEEVEAARQDGMTLATIKTKFGLKCLAHHTSWDEFMELTSPDEFYAFAHFARDQYVASRPPPDEKYVFKNCKACDRFEKCSMKRRELAEYLSSIEIAHHYSWHEFKDVHGTQDYKDKCRLARDAFHRGQRNVEEIQTNE